MFKYHFAVGVKNVWTILMNQYSGFVVPIVSVASDMWPAINEQDFFIALTCQPLGKSTSCEPRSNYNPIKHALLLFERQSSCG